MTVVQSATPKASSRAPQTRVGDGADQTDLTALIVAHQVMVWRYLRLLGADAHEADDLMQDTFVLTAERLRRGERLEQPAAFLRGASKNLLIGARRRTRRRPPTVQWIDAVDQLLQTEPDALTDQRLTLLRECVGRLRGRMREAIQYHHFEGVSCKEAARRIGIGMHGIKSLLARARQALRECVQNKVHEEQS